MVPFASVFYKIFLVSLLSMKVAASSGIDLHDTYSIIKFAARVWTGVFPLICLMIIATHGREYAGRKRAYYEYMKHNILINFADPQGYTGLLRSPLTWYICFTGLMLIWQIAVFHCPQDYSVAAIIEDLEAWGACNWSEALTDATAVFTLVNLIISDIMAQRSFAQETLVNFHTIVEEPPRGLGLAEVNRRTGMTVVVQERSKTGPSIADHWTRARKIARRLNQTAQEDPAACARSSSQADMEGKFVSFGKVPTCTWQDFQREEFGPSTDLVSRLVGNVMSGAWTFPANPMQFSGYMADEATRARVESFLFMDKIYQLQLVFCIIFILASGYVNERVSPANNITSI